MTPRCIGCGYDLTSLFPRGRCPECGRLFDENAPHSYTTLPPLVRWRLWLPGLATALCVGGFSAALILTMTNHWGSALWLGAPLAAGAVLGYRWRMRWFLLGVVSIILCAGMVTAVVSMQLAGAFCGVMLAAVFLGPLIMGVLMGVVVRQLLKKSGFEYGGYLPLIILTLLPVLWAWIAGPTSPNLQIESIETSRTINASPAEVYDSIVFFEQVDHPPPLIVEWLLPEPVVVRGAINAPGDETVCVYSSGELVKRATDVTPGQRLAFDVVKQTIGLEREVTLTGGSFELHALAGGATRLTLTTTYRPRLTPRFAWRWAERLAVHSLHGHVIEGVRLKAEP